jgi:glycosyltransferase involved in cell wall biosynthesis
VTSLVAGRPGDCSDDLDRRAAQLDDPSRLRILGHRPDVPELLAASDLFVLPSLYEGMSGAVIEAMALGLPTIATTVPGMEALVEEGVTGVLVPPGNARELERAIDRLLRDPDTRARMGEAARRRYEQRFTLDSSVPRFAELYREIATRRPVHASNR